MHNLSGSASDAHASHALGAGSACADTASRGHVNGHVSHSGPDACACRGGHNGSRSDADILARAHARACVNSCAIARARTGALADASAVACGNVRAVANARTDAYVCACACAGHDASARGHRPARRRRLRWKGQPALGQERRRRL